MLHFLDGEGGKEHGLGMEYGDMERGQLDWGLASMPRHVLDRKGEWERGSFALTPVSFCATAVVAQSNSNQLAWIEGMVDRILNIRYQ